MNVLLLKVKDLENSAYERKENKNLLKTAFGICDTTAFCGKLDKVEKTDYGPRFLINDGNSLSVVVGTFNKKVKEDAEKIMREFDAKKESYALIYGNPYKGDKLYINVNNDNGVLLVDEKTYKKFHEMREKSNSYLTGKNQSGKNKVAISKRRVEELTPEEIFTFLKERKGKATIDEIEGKFSDFDNDFVNEKIIQLLETGKAYEPKAGFVELID